jgi:formylglycine-generating enzyme required for sulfatase activity
MNSATQLRALERQRRRLAQLEQRAAADGAACAPDLLHELEETRLIVAMLEASLPSLPPSAPAQPQIAGAGTPQRVVWPADGKEMVLVPAGAFVLGAEKSYRSQDQPAHPVTLPAYYIDRTLVTVAEYMRFVGATGHAPPRIIFPGPRPPDFAQHPVTGVSWHDARAYAAWAGKRLPSEAEWEKAASWDSSRAAKRRYPWGDEWDARRCNMIDTGIGRTTPVGAFSPYGDAACGAADMAGNVFEWTASLVWNYPTQPGDGRDDPHRYGTRVRRGGSYTSEELFMRATTRHLTDPDGLFIADGFRCVADPATVTR